MRHLIAIAITLVVACTATAPQPAPTAAASGGAGERATFVLANTGGLIALDQDCHPIGRVVEIDAQTAVTTPALSLDRTRLAFSLTGAPTPTTGFGTDIYEVRLDGTGMRPLVRHEAENVFYSSPRYDPRGEAIYVQRRSAIIQGSRYVGNEDLIQRIDLKTGERRTVVRDGADPAVSPDGTRMVYVHLKQSLPDALWTVSLPDGGDARPFLRTSDTFTFLQTPRFSPDGSQLAFSGAGRQAATGGGAPAVAGGARYAHLGIPSDLLVVAADGSRLTVLGPTGDDVVPAWSPDGTRIAYVGLGSFVVVTVADKTTRTCAQGEQFFFGDAIWLR